MTMAPWFGGVSGGIIGCEPLDAWRMRLHICPGEGREYKEITDKAHLEKSGIRFNFAKPKRPCLVPDNANVYPDSASR